MTAPRAWMDWNLDAPARPRPVPPAARALSVLLSPVDRQRVVAAANVCGRTVDAIAAVAIRRLLVKLERNPAKGKALVADELRVMETE